MAKTREIKGRMKAVANIQRITKTMQMIATARFQASQRRATAAKPYAAKIAEMVHDLAQAQQGAGGQGESAQAGSLDHPLLNPPANQVDRRLLLVLTSNRGLCGGYNANVLRTTMAHLKERADQPIDLQVVGKKGLGYFKFSRVPVETFHDQFTDTPEFEQVDALADQYIEVFSHGRYRSVAVAYMSFQSVGQQRPVIETLLPLGSPTQTPARGAAGKATASTASEYELTPGQAELLAELLPMSVKTRLFQYFNEAAVSEHIARMVAMKAATDAAGKMGKSLTRQFNRARQTAITTELTEIIGGTAALE